MDEFSDADTSQRLFESGVIRLQQKNDMSFEVARGMAVKDSEGHEIGRVAAVIADSHNKTTHILLNRLSLMPLYRIVPASLIETISEDVIQLCICGKPAETLPQWQREI